MKNTIVICLILLPIYSFAQKKQNVGSTGGRFQIVQISDFRRDQFLIDTNTGRLWTQTCAKPSKPTPAECGLYVWQEEMIDDISVPKKEFFKYLDSLTKEQK